jgi:hypothetical protein
MTKAENVKVSAGDVAIALALAGKASNDKFLKALWSIRGDLKVQMNGSDLKVSIVKADMVNLHKGLPADEPAEFALKAEKDGGYLVVPAKSVRVSKPKKEQKAPTGEVAPEGAEAGAGQTGE